MIKQIIDFITGLKRPETLDYKGEGYIYNDNLKRYSRIEKNISFVRKVCNVDSFASVVLEEIKRRNSDRCGAGMTVIFNSNGGTFYTNDELKQEQDEWIFDREFTYLWQTIKSIVSSAPMSHRIFLDRLESVKIFIPGFEDLYYSLSKLKVSKKINFASNPIFSDGEQQGHYEWSQKIDTNGATEKAVCPADIPFKGKIVRGSEIEYEFSLAITPVLDEENGKILFSVSMPGIDMVMDQVREDEYKAFCEQVTDAKELLILRNY